MKLRIFLTITSLYILLLFVGCGKANDNQIVNTNLEDNISNENNNTNMKSYTYDTLHEYFELGVQSNDITDRVAYIANIEDTIVNSKIKIIDIKVDKYIIFEVCESKNKSICLLLQNETVPKIIVDDVSSSVEGILKEDYCIVDGKINKCKYIIDFTLPQNDKNFITQINVTGEIYDVCKSDWIVYLSPSNSKSLGNDIKYFNLSSKELVTYREAGENYGWVLDLYSDIWLNIYKLDLNNEEEIYYETKRLDDWQDGFEPSTAYLSYEYIDEYISETIENPTEENIKDYINSMPELISNCIVDIKEEYETDRYYVIYVEEKYCTGVDYNIVCLWEKGKPNGGMVLDNNVYRIDGLVHNKYLVTDSGTYITRYKSFYNLELDFSDENLSDHFVTVCGYCMFDDSDWVIYCPVNKNNLNDDDVWDIGLYNLKTNENIIYKEAYENYSFALKSLYNKKVDIVKIEKYDDSSTRTVIETIDLTDFSSFENNLIN